MLNYKLIKINWIGSLLTMDLKICDWMSRWWETRVSPIREDESREFPRRGVGEYLFTKGIVAKVSEEKWKQSNSNFRRFDNLWITNLWQREPEWLYKLAKQFESTTAVASVGPWIGTPIPGSWKWSKSNLMVILGEEDQANVTNQQECYLEPIIKIHFIFENFF